MIYFDTDVLINFLIEQDPAKNQRSIQLYDEASKNGAFFCSLLGLQEAAYVLSRLKISADDIETMIDSLIRPDTINYDISHYRRAVELAKMLGFQHINDCLHTAIAETYCTELYTFNESDFKRIQKYTKLKINILS